MNATITVDEQNAGFREIISELEAAPTEVGRGYDDTNKMVLAKSFLSRRNIDVETLEIKFQEWRTVALSGDQTLSGHGNGNWYYQTKYFVLESLFIIEVIRRHTCGDKKDAADGLSSIELLLEARENMIMAYNQLPFSVLESLFNFAFPIDAASADRNFLRLCIIFFSECMLITRYSQVSTIIQQLQQQRASGSEIKSFLDFLRKCHAPTFPRQPPTDPIKFTAMRKATDLQDAGMTIRPSSTNSSVCSIRYSKGLLKIPKLKINNNSKHLLINLIDYEKRNYPQDTFIIDYLHFMDSLIDTANDVNVLIHNGILDNFMPNSEEVAALFNNITKKAPMISHKYYYHGISEAVNAYCQISCHKWKATLRRDYCSSPWLVASTIAAFVLLVLTLIQTVCSVKSTSW